MTCPYCHDTGHKSLAKCPRWTVRGTTTSRFTQQALSAELDDRLRGIAATEVGATRLHDSIAFDSPEQFQRYREAYE